MASIRACFLRGRRDDHDLQGRTTVSFVIAARGRVSAADVEESSLPPEVGACIVRQVRSLRFPPPEGGVVPFSSTFSFF
jgi:TonB family protein